MIPIATRILLAMLSTVSAAGLVMFAAPTVAAHQPAAHPALVAAAPVGFAVRG